MNLGNMLKWTRMQVLKEEENKWFARKINQLQYKTTFCFQSSL